MISLVKEPFVHPSNPNLNLSLLPSPGPQLQSIHLDTELPVPPASSYVQTEGCSPHGHVSLPVLM